MNSESIIKELTFKATRSSGAGGQHVNKVSSKIVLFFDVYNSESLSDDEKEILLKNLQTKLTKENILILNCDESRSQHKNKEIVITRFLKVITEGLRVQKPRRATKIPRSVIRKRLESKKKQAFKKATRKKPDVE
ncbi:MAG: alternative ribosome rescue aminoacyl-tRNA hydrolase ArfB [Urechidicola sp.]|nr:alternative ribosome rescue aminoacyl-tRNA hydrolase ArfB [Urechidicola sp.]